MKRKILPRHSNVLLSIAIIALSLLISISYLAYRQVTKIHSKYYFTRVYDTKFIGHLYLRPIDFSIAENTMKSQERFVLNSISLHTGDTLFYKTDSPDTTSSYSFYREGIKEKSECVFRLPFKDNYCNSDERKMAYYGVFLNASNFITYTFIHVPYVCVFDDKGNFLSIIKTKDNVPSPSFIHYKNSIFYERGKTFNSNIASFVKGDFVYVISYRVPVSNKKFIFDIYNRENGDYITSIDVENGNKYCNRDIDNVVSDKQYIYLRIGENTFKLFVKQLDR